MSSGNISQTGPEAAASIHFERGGADILVDGNIFRGSSGKILVDEATQVTFGKNINGQIERRAPSVRFGNP